MNRRFTAFIAALTLAGGAYLATAGPGSAAAVPGAGAWTPSSNGLSLVRYSFRATTLLDGRVLVEGGFAPGAYTPEAEMYDPATNAWTVINPMNDGRGEQSATLLSDGRVLVAGGYAGPVLSSAEIFDPSTGQWLRTGSMNINRTRQAAVRLCDGRVLVAGGWNGQELSSAEIYDPSTGLWSLTPGSLAAPVSGLEGFLLPDCTALFVGGGAGNSAPTSAAAYIFHPDTGMFTATASMHYARAGFSGAQLADGRVLVMGGNTASSSTTAEIFDPATHQWSDVAPMTDPHTLGGGEEAQALPDGRVLVPGDAANGLTAELYDPATNTWSFTGPQNAVHYGGVTALLHDGRVLNAGGFDSARTLTTVGETYTSSSTPQVISFTSPGTGTYGGSAALTATGGGSGNPVVFTVDPSSRTGVCALSGADGSTLTYTGTGNCVIDANQAGGNGYTAAPQVQQTIAVGPATPVLSWPSPATIIYGTPLGSSELDATTSVPGTFSYSPAAGTVLLPGNYSLSVTFAPNDRADYTNATATTTISVARYRAVAASNYAGYSAHASQGTISLIQATWKVPEISCNPNHLANKSQVAVWAGLWGPNTKANLAGGWLPQAGTVSQCTEVAGVQGPTTNIAVFQMFGPHANGFTPLFDVNTGDIILAQVKPAGQGTGKHSGELRFWWYVADQTTSTFAEAGINGQPYLYTGKGVSLANVAYQGGAIIERVDKDNQTGISGELPKFPTITVSGMDVRAGASKAITWTIYAFIMSSYAQTGFISEFPLPEGHGSFNVDWLRYHP